MVSQPEWVISLARLGSDYSLSGQSAKERKAVQKYAANTFLFFSAA